DRVGRGLQRVAEHDVADIMRRHAGALDRVARGSRAQVDGRQVLQRAAERAEPRPHSGQEDDVLAGALCFHGNDSVYETRENIAEATSFVVARPPRSGVRAPSVSDCWTARSRWRAAPAYPRCSTSLNFSFHILLVGMALHLSLIVTRFLPCVFAHSKAARMIRATPLHVFTSSATCSSPLVRPRPRY